MTNVLPEVKLTTEDPRVLDFVESIDDPSVRLGVAPNLFESFQSLPKGLSTDDVAEVGQAAYDFAVKVAPAMRLLKGIRQEMLGSKAEEKAVVILGRAALIHEDMVTAESALKFIKEHGDLRPHRIIEGILLQRQINKAR